MNVEENEILFIYNSSDQQERQTFAYAQSSKEYKVKELDVEKDKLTATQLVQLADLLDNEDELVKKDAPTTDLGENDFYEHLSRNLSNLNTPILVYIDKAKLIGSQYEMIKRFL